MKKKCKLCENLVDDDDWDLCESCIEKAKTFDNAEEVGRLYKDEVLVNEFYAHCFTPEEIDELLYAEFKSKPKDEQKRLIDSYIEDDMLFFVEWLVRKCKK